MTSCSRIRTSVLHANVKNRCVLDLWYGPVLLLGSHPEAEDLRTPDIRRTHPLTGHGP